MPSATQFVRDLEKLERELGQAIVKAETKTLEQSYVLAQKLSSGTETPQTLRQKDHPYATRHGVPLLDPSRINKQRGVFYWGWRKFLPVFQANVLYTVLANFTQVANWLKLGTKKMFARPIDDRVAKEIQPKRLKNLDNAIKQVFKKFT